VEKSVKDILQVVKEKGDKALFNYTEKFDHVRLDSISVVVSSKEIEKAYDDLTKEDVDSLHLAAVRIEQFHQRQMSQLPMGEREGEGVTQVVRPLKRIGLYVPGGKASYPSSVLMSAIPARVAGVEEIIMVSPSTTCQVLAAAKVSGVSCIYRIGGAQAIAALAYGTESIPKVDKIVGAGNIYVETAKRLIFGEVGVDMVAGPSEVLIIADESAVPSFAAADLLAQAEHDEDACPMMITPSENFLQEVEREIYFQLKSLVRRKIVERSLERKGIMIIASDINEATELANRIAPEHLELMVDDPNEVLSKITCAGAAFLGNYSPVTAGDYIAGPSHILPTGGTARFFSPLGVEDFVKRMSVIFFSEEELMELGDVVIRLALLEGLDAHAKAVEKRINMSMKT
ncbi:MAG: histidinol dehydrogenase, partial [Deltaproteobacteria bacterium DG_8]